MSRRANGYLRLAQLHSMAAPPPSHIVHKYRYLDAKTGRWKMTRHPMSAEQAAKFFAADWNPYLKVER